MGWHPFAKKRDDVQFRWGTKLAREDLAVMGERLDEESGPEGPAASEWQQADTLYRSARKSLRAAETVEDVLAVQDTVCQAWYHLARSDAIVGGEVPPSRSDPCFFNPQHGPAVVEVPWAPLGGTPTSTSVCRADADRIEHGLAPRFRQIALGGTTVAFHEVRGDTGLSVEQRKELNLAVNGGYAQVYAGLAMVNNMGPLGSP
jgi:hypothetical protein